MVLSTNPLSGAKSVTFLPSPFPLFCPRFYFCATTHARKCSLIRISSGSKLGPHVHAFTSKFNIYHKNPLLSQPLAFYTTKQGKQAANSFITFNRLASPAEGWGEGGGGQQRFFGQRNFQKMSQGVSLLGMVPVDYSVKNYSSTEKMKDKLLPLDRSHVQRVVNDKNPIPRDTRNARKAGFSLSLLVCTIMVALRKKKPIAKKIGPTIRQFF